MMCWPDRVGVMVCHLALFVDFYLMLDRRFCEVRKRLVVDD